MYLEEKSFIEFEVMARRVFWYSMIWLYFR